MRRWLAIGVALLLCGCTAASPRTTSTSTPVSTGPVVVTIGDSIMRGYGVKPHQAWPALVASKAGWHLKNLACDGASFSLIGDQTECDGSFGDLIIAAAKLHPSAVIIEGASHDLREAKAGLGAAISQEFAWLHQKLPDAQLIAISVLWNDQANVPNQLPVINDQLKSAIDAVGGTFLDIGQPLTGHPEWMQADDSNPNTAGQRAIAIAVDAALAKAGVSVPTGPIEQG